MGTEKNLGIVSPVPKGEWSAEKTYFYLNLVYCNKATYIARKNNLNIEPEIHEHWSEYWVLLNKDGADGKDLYLGETSDTAYAGDKGAANSRAIEKNSNEIETLKQITIQSGMVGVLEKSQAYTSRETAEGANIVDGQKTPVLEITGDTVKCTNLFNAKAIKSSQFSVNNDGSVITPKKVTSGNGSLETGSKFSELCPTVRVGDVIYLNFTTNGGNDYIYFNAPTSKGWKASTALTVTQDHLDSKVVIYSNNYSNGYTSQSYIAFFRITYTNDEPFMPYFTGLKHAGTSIKSTGKNLLKLKKMSGSHVQSIDDNSFSVNVSAASIGRLKEIVPSLKVGDTVTLSAVSPADRQYVWLYRNQVGATNGVGWKLGTWKTIDEFDLNAPVAVYPAQVDGVDVPTVISNIQIEYGKVATEFDPYKESIYQLPQTLELGKWDKLDTQTGILTRASKKLVFDGTEAWAIGGSENSYYFYVDIPDMAGLNPSETICNKYKYLYAYGGNGVFVNKTGFYVGAQIALTFNNADINTWKAYLAELYANGNPLTIEYELAEPTTETITDIPKTYTAWKNGSETIVQGDTDNSVYGAMPTVKQTYFEILGGEE